MRISRDRTETILDEMKRHSRPVLISHNVWMRSVGYVHYSESIEAEKDRTKINYIKTFMKWRVNNRKWFSEPEGGYNYLKTKSWFKGQLLDRKDRILFVLGDEDGPIGHIGLSDFDFDKSICHIDNVIRGEKRSPGIMSTALQWLIKFARETLLFERVRVKVYPDNDPAIRYYERNGFEKFLQDDKYLIMQYNV